ncbi:MAG TPA: phosphatidate cytidylyltransferase [Gemmatimonadaceae bacterium]|nr:phosphatidate cytidylyltransferase [Gemmatimonadaceae bacterium]
MGNLARRVVVAVIGIPVAAFLVWVGELPLALFLAVAGGLGASELYRLARQRRARPFDAPGIAVAAATPLVLHLARLDLLRAPLALAMVLFVVIIGLAVWSRAPDQEPLASIAITVFGALYCSGTLAFGYALRHHDWAVGAAAGTALVGFPLVITWANDIGAYAVGRAIGKRKLMPAVSPGKTVAGAVGAALVAMVVAYLYNAAVLRPWAQLALTPWSALAVGLVLSGAAQVGDLAESLLKREAGVKDSSHLLPGHGGVLDRLDSLYFVLPVAYLLLGRLLLPAPR